MIIELLAPGVEDGRDPKVAAEAVPTELGQTLGGAVEEEWVELLLMRKGQGVEFLRQGKDAMVVTHRQDALQLVLEPGGALAAQAARAMAVATGARGPVLM